MEEELENELEYERMRQIPISFHPNHIKWIDEQKKILQKKLCRRVGRAEVVRNCVEEAMTV